MADTVRNLVELMVPELEDYERRGYFSRTESTAIVQRRQHFEYALKRRNTVKHDFLRYAEYEWKLEQLRRLRRKERAITGKKSLADYGIVRRIHFIYERATRKFKGDLGMWSAWLKFCKDSQSTQQVSKVVTKALKIHPNSPFLWTYAAAWEYEHNGNAIAARLLMQSGLQNCPTSTSLWLEYFRMELLYANKLLIRRKALGIEDNVAPEGIQASSDSLILAGQLAKLVYTQAITKCSDDAALRCRFLQIANSVPCNGTEDLLEHICDSITRDFSEIPEGVCHLADAICMGLTGSKQAGTAAACSMLLTNLNSNPSPALQSAIVAFAVQHICGLDDCSELPSTHAPDSDYRALIDLLETACGHSDSDDPSVHISYCDVLLRSGKFAAAERVAQAAVQRLPGAWQVWQCRMDVAAAGLAVAQLSGTWGLDSLEDLVGDGLNSCKDSDEWRLWKTAACLLTAGGCGLSTLAASMVRSLQVPGAEDLGSVVASVYTAVWHACGTDEAETLAQKLEACPCPGAIYWHTRLKILCGNAACHTERKVTRDVESVFERALSAHGETDVELWQMWRAYRIQMHGDMAGITWRATKVLQGNFADMFVESCQDE